MGLEQAFNGFMQEEEVKSAKRGGLPHNREEKSRVQMSTVYSGSGELGVRYSSKAFQRGDGKELGSE